MATNNPKHLELSDYLSGIKSGDVMILSRAITLIESSRTDHQEMSEKLIEQCLPSSGNSIRIGVTGVPGVGKSTFIEAFGVHLIEQHHKKVAVLAIDPTSQKSKGSILGDKTRMNQLSVNDNAYVRPTPSAGALGGVARATREAIILCEAAGFDIIIIETVGVGQSEIEVKSMVDFFLLLMLPGAGDELQGIKRGIMEIADAVIINKSDTNPTKAKMAAQEYKNALHLFPANTNGWIPKVNTCSAIEKERIDEVWSIIDEHYRLTNGNNSFNLNRKEQAKYWLQHAFEWNLKQLMHGNNIVKNRIQEIEQLVMDGKMSPFKGAHELVELIK